MPLRYIKRMEIELQSFCNRTCDWCPNKELSRNKSTELSEDAFLQLLTSLKNDNYGMDIGKHYRKLITFNRFSEPMSNIELLKKRLNQALDILPEVQYAINTNGDYLTREALDGLYLDALNIMDYDCKGAEYWTDRLEDIGVILTKVTEKTIFGFHRNVGRIACELNWPKNAVIEDRAGYLIDDIQYDDQKVNWANDKVKRNYPCVELDFYSSIDFNGSVMPCCHMRSDNPNHEKFILGNIHEQSLSEIYNSDKTKNLKHILSTGLFDEYPEECKYCNKARDGYVNVVKAEPVENDTSKEIKFGNFGRVLFYDNRSGEVLYDTCEMTGHGMDPDIEFFYGILESQFGSRKNIDSLKLKFGEHRAIFDKTGIVRVMPDKTLKSEDDKLKYKIGIKNCMNDRWYPLFENISGIYDNDNNTINTDRLDKFYRDFIFNLQSVLSIVDSESVHPSKIRRFNDSNENTLVLWDNELFPSKEEFAKDLVSDELIFPIQVSKRNDDYLIYDGSHRVIAARASYDRGDWPIDKEFPCLIFNTTNPKFIDNSDINYILDNVITMHIPKVLIEKYSFINIVSQRDIDEDIIEVKINRYLDMVLLFRMYINELTKSMSLYKKLNGETYPSLLGTVL